MDNFQIFSMKFCTDAYLNCVRKFTLSKVNDCFILRSLNALIFFSTHSLSCFYIILTRSPPRHLSNVSGGIVRDRSTFHSSDILKGLEFCLYWRSLLQSIQRHPVRKKQVNFLRVFYESLQKQAGKGGGGVLS